MNELLFAFLLDRIALAWALEDVARLQREKRQLATVIDNLYQNQQAEAVRPGLRLVKAA